MTVYVYCRVSTKEQVADGSSLPTQARVCLDYVRSRGLQLGTETNSGNPGVFADPGISAWKIPIFERPAFIAMWKLLKPGDSFVVLSLDRAFRSVGDFASSWKIFDKSNITPIFVRDNIDMSTATGRLMGNMCAAFAQFKSDMISCRVREGYLARKRLTTTRKAPKARQVLVNPMVNHDTAVISEQFGTDTSPRLSGKVYGYVRVSTHLQKNDSQDASIDRLVQNAVAQGATDGGCFCDHGVSAFTTNWQERPAGRLLFEALQPGDTIAVFALDRAFRSIIDMSRTVEDLLSRDIHIVTGCGIDTRSPGGRHAIEILAMFAAWESRDLQWRGKLSRRLQEKMYGKWVVRTNLPRWMKVKNHSRNYWSRHPNYERIDEYREVHELLLQGHSCAKIADIMEERIAARTGRPVLPKVKFRPNIFRRGALKRCTADQIKMLDRWIDWTRDRVKDVSRRGLEEIEELLGAY